MIDLHKLNRFRCVDPSIVERYGGFGDRHEGAFQLPSPVDGQLLVVIASTGLGWDHVSVSRKNRSPNQTELDFIFRTFFETGESAMQLFVPQAEHVNVHPNCLHLWRPQEEGIPKPPRIFV
jgi:hypothetical protein